MIGSNLRIRGRGWIAGTGLAWLGAGGLMIVGCSSAAHVTDARSAKQEQQVATAKGMASAKKPARQVASKNAAGKARISDLDPATRVQVAARTSQKKSTEESLASTTPRRPPSPAQVSRTPDLAKAKASGAALAARPSADVQKTSTADASVQRAVTPVKETTTSKRSSSRVSGRTIQQASADGPSVPESARRTMAVSSTNRPVITPSKSSLLYDRSDYGQASNHERRRADRLMQRAYTMFETGYREEALRLASVALELENSRQAVYQPGEDRPSDFIALLQASGTGNRLPTSDSQPCATDCSDEQASTTVNNRKPAVRIVTGQDSSLAAVFPQGARDQRIPVATAPHFTASDSLNMRSAANAGRAEVPLAPSRQIADVNIVTVDDNASLREAAEASATAPSVISAEQVDEAEGKAVPPKTLTDSSTSSTPARAALDASDIETDPVVEATTSDHSSQLTIASLIGLFSGVGGMFGLSWWRRQERRHYAAGK
jgi:hypothetical protein